MALALTQGQFRDILGNEMNIFNASMAKIVVANRKGNAKAPEKLNEFAANGITSFQGALIFTSNYNTQVRKVLESGIADLSGYEHVQNKFYINDYCTDHEEVFATALAFFYAFPILLREENISSAIYYSLSLQPNSEFGDLASFTFHKDRGESVVDIVRIEEYAEPVLISRIGN